MIPETALRALAHPARRQMLEMVWSTEWSSSELADATGLTRPAASQHLKVLRSAGLVAVRKAGQRRYYQARLETVDELRAFLDSFWGTKLERLVDEVDGT